MASTCNVEYNVRADIVVDADVSGDVEFTLLRYLETEEGLRNVLNAIIEQNDHGWDIRLSRITWEGGENPMVIESQLPPLVP